MQDTSIDLSNKIKCHNCEKTKPDTKTRSYDSYETPKKKYRLP